MQWQAPPRFATPRNYDRPTYGPAVAKLQTALGTPPMPWQREANDLMGEVNPDTGLLAYGLVLISVPRQAGKTTITLGNGLHRCLMGPNRRAWHTAQTGKDAREKWLELMDSVAQSPLRSLVDVKRGAGTSFGKFVNGSEYRPFPPMVDALHGRQSDFVSVDEGWAFSEAEGDALEQAIYPTQATRPGAQVVVLSTAGDANSTWWHTLIDRAMQPNSGIALIDYGIPDDVDPTDLDEVARWHPAIGHTITRDTLAEDAKRMTVDAFARAYGNRRTATRRRLFDAAKWEAAATDALIPAGAEVGFGAAVAYDRSEGAIAAAAYVDGIPVVVVLENRPGRSWMAERCLEIIEPYGTARDVLAVDHVGPSSTLHADLTAADAPLIGLTPRDVSTAVTDWLDRIDEGRLKYRPDPGLSRAADVAVLRDLGDGKALSRKGSRGSVACLEAGILAVHALTRADAPEPAPLAVL